jgi:hypothetical protein
LSSGDELKQKIRMEKREIERLHQDIIELRMIREDMSDSDHESNYAPRVCGAWATLDGVQGISHIHYRPKCTSAVR